MYCVRSLRPSYSAAVQRAALVQNKKIRSESLARRSLGEGGVESSRPDRFLKKTAKFSLPGDSVSLPDSSLRTESRSGWC